MKIDTCAAATPPPSSTHATKTASGDDKVAGVGAGTATSAAATAASNTVDISSARSTGSASPVDHARVHSLRASILDGSYRIDSGRIADRMVDLEKRLP